MEGIFRLQYLYSNLGYFDGAFNVLSPRPWITTNNCFGVKQLTNYIFSTGTARGGTGLFAHMLSVNKKVKIISDPMLGLFKSFRNAVIRNCNSPQYENFNSESAIGDNDFTFDRRNILTLLSNSDLNLPFENTEWATLIPSLQRRAALASGDLVENLGSLSGATYLKVFENALSMFSQKRSPNQYLDWIGVHENWAIDFFIPLAKTFPEAKFFVITRDPRAVFTSNSRERDKSVIGHLVSYARCHRKMLACANYYQNLDLFRDRLLVVRYEDLVLDPSRRCKEICDFLGIDFNPAMLDTSNYFDHAKGEIHNGLSTYETNAQGFDPKRIDRWKSHLSQNREDLIDFLCGPEMALFDYQTTRINPTFSGQTRCLNTMIDEMSGYKAWRCDFGDPLQDFGFELFRRHLITNTIEEKPSLKELIENNFLFPEVYQQIRKTVL